VFFPILTEKPFLWRALEALFSKQFFLLPRSPRASVVLLVFTTYITASLCAISLFRFFFWQVPLGSDADLTAQSAGFLRDSDYYCLSPNTVLTLLVNKNVLQVLFDRVERL